MPRGKLNKLYRTWNKGLITEAGYLTYPEDASIAELNTVISRKGNRSRRFGIDFESEGSAIVFDTVNGEVVTNEFSWLAVANKSNLNFLVQQIGSLITFLDQSSVPKSSGYLPYQVDLANYASGYLSEQIPQVHAQFAAGKGFLFIAHPLCETIILQYNPDTGTITPTKILLQIRDFKGINDGLANDEEPETLSAAHNYNLVNQGWLQPAASGGSTVTDPIYYNPGTGGYKDYTLNGIRINAF